MKGLGFAEPRLGLGDGDNRVDLEEEEYKEVVKVAVAVVVVVVVRGNISLNSGVIQPPWLISWLLFPLFSSLPFSRFSRKTSTRFGERKRGILTNDYTRI